MAQPLPVLAVGTDAGHEAVGRALRDDLLVFSLAWIDRWLELPYQGLHFADDWGSQTNLLISPKRWRLFDVAREA